MSDLRKEEYKILNSIIQEPDEFKRYVLLQLWITQLYTSTINDSKLLEYSAETDDVTAIYNTFRNIRTALETKNNRLSEVSKQVESKYIMIKCMNELLSLDKLDAVNELKAKLDVIKSMIAKNQEYIQCINNLSESKINDAIKN